MIKDEITLKISSGDNDVTLVFPKTAKIKDVEQAAITELGLPGSGDSFELVYDGQTLKPEQRTLISFGIPNNACLELVATGTGV